MLTPGDDVKTGPITLKAVADGKVKGLEEGYTLKLLESIDPEEAKAVVDNYQGETRRTIQARYKAAKLRAAGNPAPAPTPAPAPAPANGAGPVEMVDTEYQQAIDHLSSGAVSELINNMMAAIPRLPRGMRAAIDSALAAIAKLEEVAQEPTADDGEGDPAQE
jgi:hypothetical protein